MSTVAVAQPLAADPVAAEASVPPLVPARMLNEYAYCPTLFFLEWMDFLWASNADVAEGSRRHGRIDVGGQRYGHQPRGDSSGSCSSASMRSCPHRSQSSSDYASA